MKCPYCGRKMKTSKDIPFPLSNLCCDGGFFKAHEAILWCGDKFLTGSEDIARELSSRGFHIRKEMYNNYGIIP